MREMDSLQPRSITPAVVNRREIIVFAGDDREALPVHFVDLDSGAPLPDRSVLHGADGLRLARARRGSGPHSDGHVHEQVAAAVEARGFRVRDTVTGEELIRRDEQYRETAGPTVAVTAVAYRGRSCLTSDRRGGPVDRPAALCRQAAGWPSIVPVQRSVGRWSVDLFALRAVAVFFGRWPCAKRRLRTCETS